MRALNPSNSPNSSLSSALPQTQPHPTAPHRTPHTPRTPTPTQYVFFDGMGSGIINKILTGMGVVRFPALSNFISFYASELLFIAVS